MAQLTLNEQITLLEKLQLIYDKLNDNGNVPDMSEIHLYQNEVEFLTQECGLNIEFKKPLDFTGIEKVKELELSFKNDTSLSKTDNLINQMIPQEINKPITSSEAQPKHLRIIDDLDYMFLFGKNSGSTVRQILITNPQYLLWIHDNVIQGMRLSPELLNKALLAKNSCKPTYQKPSYQQPPSANAYSSDGSISDYADDLPF